MKLYKTITAAALAAGLTLGVAGAAFAGNNGPQQPGPDQQQQQQQQGPEFMCERDLYTTTECYPNYGQNYGPDSRDHAFELGLHILK